MVDTSSVDTSSIHALIARARRRLRLQAALESGTTAAILAVGLALAVIYGMRLGLVAGPLGPLLLGGCAGIVLAGALVGALRRLPTHVVATRIDRASGLSDRLATACAFEDQLRDQAPADEDTAALMRAAMNDAVRAVPRADVVAATRFHAPRDGRTALAFGAVALVVAGLSWSGPEAAAPAVGPRPPGLADLPREADALEEDDIDYTRDLLEDLRRVAEQERSPELERFVREIEELLTKAEQGEISKEELLEGLARAEERFMQGAGEDMEESLADLRETGRELAKNPITKDLGKALQEGNLEQAQKEMEALAQKIDKGELNEKQQEDAAKALQKAAEQFAKKEQQRDQQAEQRIAQAKEQIRRLQRKQDQSKDPQEKQRLSRRLEDKKRELKRLQREKQEREQSAQQRTLKRLHRNLEQASQQMRKQDQKDQKDQKDQQNQQRRRMASQSLRNAAKDTGQVDQDRRKVAAQKKVASQLTDLKEAMRRARRRGQNGPRDLFGKNRRNLDFERRAQGQQGSRGAWKPGQKPGQKLGQGQNGQRPGQGQNGQQPGQQGQGQQGDTYGDQHDPNLIGDPTARLGNAKDESLSGVQGRGPSRRETILSAAQKGFSSRSYQEVYADYKNIVEEVMRVEKVPRGYKYYVKRYFQKIKPHSMD